METEDQARHRFQLELEFVQCLANPNYLNFLAQRGYLREKPFVNYLKYLLYWKEPEYAKFLKYPHCLHMLELLQYEHFRKELVNAQCAKFIDEQQILHWQHYSRKRTRLQQALVEQQQQQQQPQAPSHGNTTSKWSSQNAPAGNYSFTKAFLFYFFAKKSFSNRLFPKFK